MNLNDDAPDADALPRPYRVSVVVQTHWDREWYFPQQTFAARLLAVMQRVCAQLDAGALAHFLFDGQAAALDDLLDEAEPDLASRVLSHVRAGRIAIGPWYVMADEFLVSGESLWRNLEIGLAAAGRHGVAQRVGYLPDSFGHVAQMPQLLRRHGIASAVVWRGVDLRHAEFRWAAPDGSEVDGIFMPEGYYQHPLNTPDWQAALTRHLDAIAPRSFTGVLLLTQGGDHLAPSADVPRRIAAFNAAQQRYTLEQRSLADHVAMVHAALDALASPRPLVRGELRDNTQSFVLPDVLSTRRHLKAAHQQLEDRLLGETEPLWAWLAAVQPPLHALERTWQQLLLNQAHDSICGCSVDAVHDEMESRFERLQQRLDGLRQRALADAGLAALLQHGPDGGAHPFADDSVFTLFNPLPLAREGWQPLSLLLAGPAPQALRLLDAGGEPLPLVWLGCTPARRLVSPLDDFPEPVIGHRVELRARVPQQGLAASALRLDACDGEAPGAVRLAARTPLEAGAPAALHWSHGRIELDADGALWQHAADGGRAQWLLHTELDAGDSYNHAPPPEPHRRWHATFRAVAVQHGDAVQRLHLEASFEQPARLRDDRAGPVLDGVTTRVALTLDVHDGSPWVEATLVLHQAAEDQRTRLVLAAGESIATTDADTAFCWNQRPVVLAEDPAAPSRREMPVAVNPSLSALRAGRLAVLHRGLQEFEVLAGAPGHAGHALGLTLSRSVGWLSRRDLVTRGVGAGPDLPTPGAQRVPPIPTPFAVALDGQADAAALLNASLLRRRPSLVLQGRRADAWRVPFTLPHPGLVPSALRRRADGRLELRLWNPSEDAIHAALPGWAREVLHEADDDAAHIGPHVIATYTRSAA
jgi:hypothetical protein